MQNRRASYRPSHYTPAPFPFPACLFSSVLGVSENRYLGTIPQSCKQRFARVVFSQRTAFFYRVDGADELAQRAVAAHKAETIVRREKEGDASGYEENERWLPRY